MATSLGGGVGQIVTMKAADAYTTHQFYPVKITAANTVGTCSADTDRAIGILQNKPEAIGASADVLLLSGISKVVTGGTIAAGADLYLGTDGRVVAALTASSANSLIIGKALEAATTTAASGGGDIISALLQPTIGTTS